VLARQAGKPFAVFAVNADEDRAAGRKARADTGMTWPSVWDGKLGPVARRWNVQMWPTKYLIDASGVIRYKTDYLRRSSVRIGKDGKPEQFSYLDVAVDELMAEHATGPKK
jgi:hypothetical protein